MSLITNAKDNIGTIGIGVGSFAAGAALGSIATSAYRKRKSSKRKKRRVKAKRKSSYRKRGKQKKPYTAKKRKDTSHRRIRYTKNNQPYVIMASGKARFISKKSVRSSRKRKGGKY
jgi:hypothetical protein